MNDKPRKVVILGSTGSIGRSTLEVIAGTDRRWQIAGLTAHNNLGLLCRQANQFHPDSIVATDAARAAEFCWPILPECTRRRDGREAMLEEVARPEVDLVVAAIVGSAGLSGTWAALQAGKDVALANKETLVMAGPLVMRLAAERGARILPVDSEHSAIFQALRCGCQNEVHRIILTASGGPFRSFSSDQLASVTVEQALAHPTWDMGPKITVDSATMMNKALEIIEARWLFDLPPERIGVVVHPQSVVHSMVEFRDGSVIAQMGPPDMKLPIQYALSYPERCEGPAERLNLAESLRLDFEPPDFERFPALKLGYEVAGSGGTAGAVLNAANEAAVAGFLDGQLGFDDIVPACRSVLDHHNFDAEPTLDELIQLDQWARQEVTKWICT